jgi:hypothetical protein
VDPPTGAAIKSADPDALVTVGLIQWSVPVLLAAPWQYSGFRPIDRRNTSIFWKSISIPWTMAPISMPATNPKPAISPISRAWSGKWRARQTGRDRRVRLVWRRQTHLRWRAASGGDGRTTGSLVPSRGRDHGGIGLRLAQLGLFTITPNRTMSASSPGLLKVDGTVKAWGHEFSRLSRRLSGTYLPRKPPTHRPLLNWDEVLCSTTAGHDYRERYYQAWLAEP